MPASLACFKYNFVWFLGGSLADAISENYRNMRYFSEPELKDLLLQVARGLKYIHSMSLVHMDIKPSKYSKVLFSFFSSPPPLFTIFLK